MSSWFGSFVGRSARHHGRRLVEAAARRCGLAAGLVLALAAIACAADPAVREQTDRAPPRLPDVAQLLSPAAVHLQGWLGNRVALNESQRLLVVDTEPLLAGFHKKPGSHPWIGEHVGKWMHAATLAWVNTGDAALREKLDRVAADLVSAQEPDGYLGTYLPAERFGLYRGADWDVWSHKYNLLGLLTYYHYTGNAAALDACRRMGDLLIATFPAKKSILAAGTHMGMAATSVLEPIVLLYRATGEPRYLDFARYIVQSWDEPGGPKIMATLLAEKRVDKTANGKAYEMLSNLVGLCELARATGDRGYLQPVLNAWQDVVDKRLYPSGSASYFEHFHDDYNLPSGPSYNICETCVTVTWIQLNLQLLRLTGEARFGDELDRAFYNHLAAAQHPAGAEWCYYTPLEGRKQYDKGVHCCHSSGPRGMALAPQTAYLCQRTAEGDTLLVSTLETSQAALSLGGQTVQVDQQSGFPRDGSSVLTLHPAAPARFAVKIRVPDWAAPATVDGAAAARGWATLPARPWNDGQQIVVRFNLSGRVLVGSHGNQNRAALAWGPFLLACDASSNPGLAINKSLALASLEGKLPAVPSDRLTFLAEVIPRRAGKPVGACFVPFAEAGLDRAAFRVWLSAPGAPVHGAGNVLEDGVESRSRRGNLGGSILDPDYAQPVVTFDYHSAPEDWYAVALDPPATIVKIVFAHGKTFHDGGWFDASGGKPKVQVRRTRDAAWETVGELGGYPATTATSAQGLRAGEKFTLNLSQPTAIAAVRVIGKPASGDNPRQAFSSCAGLQAFGKE